MVNGGAEEVGRGAVELFVFLTTFPSPEVLVRRHRHVDVRVESPGMFISYYCKGTSIIKDFLTR